MVGFFSKRQITQLVEKRQITHVVKKKECSGKSNRQHAERACRHTVVEETKLRLCSQELDSMQKSLFESCVAVAVYYNSQSFQTHA